MLDVAVWVISENWPI